MGETDCPPVMISAGRSNDGTDRISIAYGVAQLFDINGSYSFSTGLTSASASNDLQDPVGEMTPWSVAAIVIRGVMIRFVPPTIAELQSPL